MVERDMSYLFGGIFMLVSFIYFCFLYYALRDTKQYHMLEHPPHIDTIDHIVPSRTTARLSGR